MYYLYYLEDLEETPVGIIWHQNKFYRFFHHWSGNPYLGLIHTEASKYKLAQDNSTDKEQE
jgi:hypothetical protein